MNHGVISKMTVNLLWYFTFLIGLNGYSESIGAMFTILILWTLFGILDRFLSKYRVTGLVKFLAIMWMVYQTGSYGAFYNPLWVYNLTRQAIYDFGYLYIGQFSDVQAAPMIFNIIFFVMFRSIIIKKRSNIKYTLIITFVGAGLLMALSMVQHTNFSILTLLFVFIGIVKMVFDNLEQNNLKVESERFLHTALLSIFVIVVLSRSLSVPVSLGDQFEILKLRIEDGFTSRTRVESRPRLSGYYSNDQLLGGPIELSDRPVFTMRSEIPIYLRGESKYYYTGTGWTDEIINRENVSASDIPFREYANVTYQDIGVNVDVLNSNFHVIFSGLGTTSVNVDRGSWILLTNENDLMINFQIVGGDSYELVLKNPTYTSQSLRSMAPYRSDFPYEQYTQLPDTFPDSVKELAAEITADYTNNYDKSLAIRNYLSGRDFSYNLEVPFPPRGMDFVEHFLTMQEGYCVHYSTAFVVMARSVGIPARWVKGYSPGYRTGDNEYTITDANAHAWSEIYLPEAGWVTIEATPGFQRRLDILDDETTPGSPNNPGQGEDVEDPGTDPTDEPQEPGQGEDGESQESSKGKFQILGFILVVLSLVGTFGFFNERNIENKLTTNQKIARLYNKIISNLGKFGFGKKDGETPREYLSRLSFTGKMSLKPFSDLTDEFESAYYGNNKVPTDKYTKLKGKQSRYSITKLIYYKLKTIIGKRLTKRK